MKTIEQVICISLTTTTFKVQIYPVSSMQSVYIPHIPVAYTSEMVTYIFDHFAIGQVNRVDFLAPHETNPRIRQAFVHFNAYRNDITSTMMLKHALNQSYRLIVDNQGHYWDLCENKKPVPETHLNINQLAENMRILQASFESKIAELTEKLAVIPQMQEEIATLKSRIRYLEDPEWLMSTGTGFDNGPLTTSMLNEDIEDEDSCCDDTDNEEYDASAAIHPCNASEYAAAINPCDIAFCQDDENDNENHDLCDNSFSDDISSFTPPYSMEMSTDNAANFRAEIENHFVNERAKVAPPPLLRTNSVHCYDEAVDVDVDDNDDDDVQEVPTANDDYPFVSIAYADDGRIYVEYE
jgi:hypothetical protein